MTAKELDDTLKTIAANAKAMRDAGVVGRVVVDGIEFDIAGPEPTVSPSALLHFDQAVDDGRGDLLDDPATYGADEVPRRRSYQDDEE